jgi:UDP-GlcNAc:undecaprenyl-phosphate GlcNAc-1-phosphate transferase
MCLGITGATLGFLRFNTHPANIFMGDTGSQFLGFGASIVSIRLTQQADIKLSPLLPLILLGIPIFDTMAVMLRRMARGASPFSPDRNHIHHRLLDMGFDHYEVVVILYVLQGFLSVAAFLLRYADDIILAAFIAVVFGAIFGSLHLGDRYPGRFRREKTPSTSPDKHLGYRFHPNLYVAIKCLLALTPSTIIVLSGYYSNTSSLDLSVLAWAISLLFFITSLRKTQPHLLHIEHIAQYILCSISAFLLYKIAANTDTNYIRLLAAYLFAFTCFLLIFPPPNSAKFELTPLDYLVMLVAAFLAELPVENLQLQILALCLSCLIMLLYITEFVIANEVFPTRKLRIGTLLTACGLAASLFVRT